MRRVRASALWLVLGSLWVAALCPPSAAETRAASSSDDATAPTDPAEQHWLTGRRAYDAGDFARARDEFGHVLQMLDPTAVANNASSGINASPAGTVPAEAQGPLLAATPGAPMSLPDDARRSPLDAPALNSASAMPLIPYVVGRADVLSILVWQVPDLTRDVTVRPDGKISFPLIGEQPAEGLTLTELTQILTDRLQLYVRAPQVSIELKSLAQQRVIVLGEVNAQGVYPFTSRAITAPEAIAQAGGFKRIGSKIRDVVVIKDYPRHPQLYHVDVKALLSKGIDPQRLLVEGGDILYVSRSWVGNVQAFIEVASPVLSTVFQGVSAYTLYNNLQ